MSRHEAEAPESKSPKDNKYRSTVRNRETGEARLKGKQIRPKQ